MFIHKLRGGGKRILKDFLQPSKKAFQGHRCRSHSTIDIEENTSKSISGTTKDFETILSNKLTLTN
jgi:hypothetical protein